MVKVAHGREGNALDGLVTLEHCSTWLRSAVRLEDHAMPPKRETLGDSSSHRSTRAGVRLLGGVLALAGGTLAVIGFADFFSTFGTMRPPGLFWCCFVGVPVLMIGLALLRFGFLGAVTRYTANEVAPVASETTRHLVSGSKDLLQDISHPAGDAEARLAKLARLKANGLITQVEYDVKRGEIIKTL